MAAGEGITKYEPSPSFAERIRGYMRGLVELPEPRAATVHRAKLPRVNGYDPGTKYFRGRFVDREQLIRDTGIDPFDANAISFGAADPPYVPPALASFLEYADRQREEAAQKQTDTPNS